MSPLTYTWSPFLTLMFSTVAATAVPPRMARMRVASILIPNHYARDGERLGGGMIIGAHSIIYSRNAEADRTFLKDVLGFPSVDVGHGWLIFGLPPAEVAVHPDEENDVHEFYLMCDDLDGFLGEMKAKNVACSDVHDMPWGKLTQVSLPGGGQLGVY